MPQEILWQAREGFASPQAQTHPETGLILPGSEIPEISRGGR